MNKAVPSIIVLGLLLASCDKEDRLRHKYSGLYTVNSQERHWYANDSTVTVDDVGTLGLYDNDLNPYNNVTFILNHWPPSWDHNDVGGDFHDMAVGWYTDDVDGNTLTMFSEDEFAFYYAIYTVEHEGGRDYSWSYVELDANDEIAYREVWKVTRK